MSVIAALYFKPNLPYLILIFSSIMLLALQLLGGLWDADHDGGHDGWLHSHVWDRLDIGHVPSALPAVVFIFFLGLGGCLGNALFVALLGDYLGWYVVPVLIFALCLGALTAIVVALAISKTVPLSGVGSTSPRDLLSKVGLVASPVLDGEHGEVRVKDASNVELLVHARVDTRVDGEQVLYYGTPVILVDYNETTRLYWVTVMPAEAGERG